MRALPKERGTPFFPNCSPSKIQRRAFHAFAAIALQALALTSYAAESTQEYLSKLSLEELADIDVSAVSLLHASLLDAGSSISAIGPEDWQRRGARRMLDALETQPATLVLPHTSGNQVLAIRGYARSTSYTGVATSWDGVPINDLFRSAPQFNVPSINLGALSQIQLIQGPGSALYGSDAFHGLVALRGFESGHDMQQATAAAGSDGYYETALQISRPLFDGVRLNAALAANGQPDQHRHARYVNPVNGQERDNERANQYGAQTLSLKLASDAGRALSWYGGLYVYHYEADAFQGLGTRLSGDHDLGWLDTRFTMAQAGVRQRLDGDRSLELKGYYWWVDNDLASNLQLASGPVHRDLLTAQYRAGVQAIYRDAYRAWNTELALAVGDEWLGVASAKAEVRSTQGQLLSTVRNNADGARRHIRSATLEANTNWAERRWSLVYGGRIDDYSDFGSHTSPRLGLIYHPQPDSAIKLLYGQAFRAPSAVEIGGAQNSVLGNPNLKPEIIDSYELIALKHTPLYRTQFTLFRSFWRDGISAVLTQQGQLTQYQNVDRNDAYGASASIQYHAGGWMFDAAGSYVRSRNSRTGAAYNIFPRYMLNAGVGHALFDASCQIYLSQRWMSEVDDIPSSEGFPTQTLPRYARTDLTITKDFSPRLRATLQLRNLFDRDNRLPSPPASIGGIPDERFSINLGMNYRF